MIRSSFFIKTNNTSIYNLTPSIKKQDPQAPFIHDNVYPMNRRSLERDHKVFFLTKRLEKAISHMFNYQCCIRKNNTQYSI